MHGSATGRYLQEVIQPVTEVTSRRRLRSSSSSALGKAPERLLSDLFKYSFFRTVNLSAQLCPNASFYSSLSL